MKFFKISGELLDLVKEAVGQLPAGKGIREVHASAIHLALFRLDECGGSEPNDEKKES